MSQTLPSVAVFDPFFVEGKSLQWSNVALDASWDEAEQLIHPGWPARSSGFPDQEAILYGVIDPGDGPFWFYRVFPGGKEKHGRSGRYFMVLCKLHSPEQTMNALVTAVLRYFEKERSLPLQLQGLNPALQSADIDATQRLVADILQSGRRLGHWGINIEGTTTEFTPPVRKVNLPDKQPSRRWPLAVAAILACMGMHSCYKSGYKGGYREGFEKGRIEGYQQAKQEELSNERTNSKEHQNKEPGLIRRTFDGIGRFFGNDDTNPGQAPQDPKQ